MGAALTIPVASAELPSLNPPTPTSSERAHMGYYGILWVSMVINGILRNSCGKPCETNRPKAAAEEFNP